MLDLSDAPVIAAKAHRGHLIAERQSPRLDHINLWRATVALHGLSSSPAARCLSSEEPR